MHRPLHIGRNVRFAAAFLFAQNQITKSSAPAAGKYAGTKVWLDMPGRNSENNKAIKPLRRFASCESSEEKIRQPG